MSHPIGKEFDKDCPGRAILDHVTGRWGVLILSTLSPGPLRFYELRNRVDGISDKILIQNLRVLAADGLVERTVVPTSPPKVSYALTELGQGLGGHLQSLLDWIVAHTADITEAQRRHARPPGPGPS
ncbi:winged helix-turn-helix transcriptional regulator [Nonomuraea typhae]|uniref:winged helix-turn-helix transcriptional regulator n=1 Tax=Nonomuraea typhae TaxID=2603600 RepID=UPI0012F980B3|nr:helix-turn-helix domain-containing protein [Nonomuraea typhae]